jgi:hypothetical protein
MISFCCNEVLDKAWGPRSQGERDDDVLTVDGLSRS